MTTLSCPASLPSAVAETTRAGTDTWSANPHPTDGRPFYGLAFRLTKFTHYKPAGRKQMGGAKGRWQERGDHGGWDNCTAPTGPWIFAGHIVPDALHLALAAPELASALRSAQASLDELLDYSGGADNALADPYVVERAQLALASARTAVATADRGGRDG